MEPTDRLRPRKPYSPGLVPSPEPAFRSLLARTTAKSTPPPRRAKATLRRARRRGAWRCWGCWAGLLRNGEGRVARGWVGGANVSSRPNDGAGLGSGKGRDGVRLGGESEWPGTSRTRLMAYLSGGVGSAGVGKIQI